MYHNVVHTPFTCSSRKAVVLLIHLQSSIHAVIHPLVVQNIHSIHDTYVLKIGIGFG